MAFPSGSTTTLAGTGPAWRPTFASASRIVAQAAACTASGTSPRSSIRRLARTPKASAAPTTRGTSESRAGGCSGTSSPGSRSTVSILRSSAIAERPASSMSPRALRRSASPATPSSGATAAARIVISPSPCDARSCSSRAIRSRSCCAARSAAHSVRRRSYARRCRCDRTVAQPSTPTAMIPAAVSTTARLCGPSSPRKLRSTTSSASMPPAASQVRERQVGRGEASIRPSLGTLKGAHIRPGVEGPGSESIGGLPVCGPMPRTRPTAGIEGC